VRLDARVPAMPWLVLAASLLICFGFWRWAETILVPVNTSAALAKARPIGNNSDLYARWLGARELLLRRRDPYSPEMTREIQIGFYGRPLDSRNPSDPSAQESFVYPLYIVFLLAPTIFLPFAVVKHIFQWLLLGCIAGSVPLWMNAVGFRTQRLLILSGMLLAVSSTPALFEFHQQNLTSLMLLFLAAAGAAAVRNWLGLSGVLLALGTMKPDTSGLMILWFLLWSLSQWRERWRLVWGFAGTMAALLIVAHAVAPGWISRFLAAIREYLSYGTDPSILQVLLPSLLAKLVVVGLLLGLAALCWSWRKAPAGSEDFGRALAWVGTVTLSVIPKVVAYNQLLLIPALLCLLAQYRRILSSGLLRRALVKGAFACQIWQWAAALALSAGSFLIPATKLRTTAHVPEYLAHVLTPTTLLAIVCTTSVRAPQRTRP
jgi:hypothetical protein